VPAACPIPAPPWAFWTWRVQPERSDSPRRPRCADVRRKSEGRSARNDGCLPEPVKSAYGVPSGSATPPPDRTRPTRRAVCCPLGRRRPGHE
jgi:hypothetical protein